MKKILTKKEKKILSMEKLNDHYCSENTKARSYLMEARKNCNKLLDTKVLLMDTLLVTSDCLSRAVKRDENLFPNRNCVDEIQLKDLIDMFKSLINGLQNETWISNNGEKSDLLESDNINEFLNNRN